MVWRLLDNLLGSLITKQAKKLPKCESCKTPVERDGQPPVFLLPVFFDKEYQPSAAYYQQNCVRIRNEGGIPTGQRACRIWTLRCPACGRSLYLVEDFLKVRDDEVTRGLAYYEIGELDLMGML